MLDYCYSTNFSMLKVFTILFTLQFHALLSFIFLRPTLSCFTPLELLTGSSLFLP